jgi:tetratricopeptide (TPR) repeat protein
MNNIILKYPVLKKYLNVIFIILFCTYSYASYIQSEKYKNSSIFWTTAYYDAPDYHVACGCLGIEYLQIGNLEKAGEFLLLANKYSPGIYLLDIGILMIHKQKFDEAEKLLLKSAEIVPATKYLAYGNLSELYIKKNNFKKGLEYAEMAYNLNNKYININSSQLLIKAYILNNEFEKALNICLGMLKHDRNNPQYYYTIGALYETLKDYKNALKYIEEGLKLAPENIQLIEKTEYLKKIQK